MKNILKSYFAFLFIFTIGITSCEKSNPDISDSSIALTTSKSRYTSYEIMEIQTTSSIFTTGNISATIGTSTLSISTNEGKGYLLLPKLNDGNHELRFKVDEQEYLVKFEIQNLIDVATPEVYLQTANQELTSNIAFIEQQIDSLTSDGVPSSELTLLTQDLARYRQVMQDQVAAFNQLSIAEKAEFAAFMAANKHLIDSLKILNAPLSVSVNTLRIAQQVDNYESNVNQAEIKFVKKVITTVAHIPLLQVCFQLVAVPNPIFSAGATIAAVIITTDFILEVDKTATMGKRLVKKRIKPFLLLLPATNSFLNNQEAQVEYNASYRDIVISDPNNRIQNNENGPVIQRIANYYNAFKTAYENFRSLLPSFLRPSYVVSGLSSNSSSFNRPVFNNYIQIANCSNPNVSLSQLNQPDGSIKIKASTTLTGTQNFSYDISYTNTEFTTNLKQTVNASVTNGSPCPDALGTYQVKNFFIANPGTYDWGYMILLPDGVMKYRLNTESTYRTYSYTMAGCLVILNAPDVFVACPNSGIGFVYESGRTNYASTVTCGSVYRSHFFYKQ